MAELLHITEVPEALLEEDDPDTYRVLYVLEEAENTIKAFFYTNHDEIDDDDIRAEFDDIYEEDEEQLTYMGEVEVEDDNDGAMWLKQVEVKLQYRQNGIASQLMTLAVEHLALNYIACVREHESYLYDLTPFGEALIASCVRNAIIPPDMCRFSGDVPLDGDNSDDEDGDPGYDALAVRQALPAHFQLHGAPAYHDTDDDEDYASEQFSAFEDDDAAPSEEGVVSEQFDVSEDDDAQPISPREGIQKVTGQHNLFSTGSQSDGSASSDSDNAANDVPPAHVKGYTSS